MTVNDFIKQLKAAGLQPRVPFATDHPTDIGTRTIGNPDEDTPQPLPFTAPDHPAERLRPSNVNASVERMRK